MEVEQIEIVEFLRQHEPFDLLPDEELERIALSLEIAYFRAGTDILTLGDPVSDLGVIRSGSVESYRRNGALWGRLGEGEVFGQWSLLMGQVVRMPVHAIEDTLVYFVPAEVFFSLCEADENFALFMELEDRLRLHQAVSDQTENNNLMVTNVRELITRDPVVLSCHASICDAAKHMSDNGVSSLLLMETNDVGELTTLEGIITDRDFRVRVIAEGVAPNSPVSQIMTTQPVTIDDDAYASEAVLTMLRANVHHLPVMDNNAPVGVIGMSDVIRHESQSSLSLVRSIFWQTDVNALAELQPDVTSCFVRMVNEDANSHMIGSAMSVIGKSFKQRLLELAEETLGPPPVPYCFLAMGSMARDEQVIVTDQDNALLLSNRYDHTQHKEYFENLAAFVSDGLAASGYTYCTGGIMATNPKWRKTFAEWKACFEQWIDEPDPQALLNFSIFFDLEGVHGKVRWVDDLNQFVVNKASKSPKFLAALARNALNRTPPLGFFRQFVLESDGQHRRSMNLKRRGTAPLTDIIRVHALAIGSTSRNSMERLNDIKKKNILPKGQNEELRDALEFISMVRIRYQAKSIEQNEAPNNDIDPQALSGFERRTLKDAFQVLSNAQRFLRFRYPG